MPSGSTTGLTLTGNPRFFWGIANEVVGTKASKSAFALKSTAPHMLLLTILCRRAWIEFICSPVGSLLASDAEFTLNSTFNLYTITQRELVRHVPGVGGVSASILKEHFNFISKPLLHIINCRLSSGTVPDDFKHAKVFLLFETNWYSDTNNFRQISLLSVFPKMFESAVRDQLVAYLRYKAVVTEPQYGFREHVYVNREPLTY